MSSRTAAPSTTVKGKRQHKCATTHLCRKRCGVFVQRSMPYKGRKSCCGTFQVSLTMLQAHFLPQTISSLEAWSTLQLGASRGRTQGKVTPAWVLPAQERVSAGLEEGATAQGKTVPDCYRPGHPTWQSPSTHGDGLLPTSNTAENPGRWGLRPLTPPGPGLWVKHTCLMHTQPSLRMLCSTTQCALNKPWET